MRSYISRLLVPCLSFKRLVITSQPTDMKMIIIPKIFSSIASLCQLVLFLLQDHRLKHNWCGVQLPRINYHVIESDGNIDDSEFDYSH